MTKTNEMQVLVDAVRLMEAQKLRVVCEPMAIFSLVCHATAYLNDQLAAMLRGRALPCNSARGTAAISRRFD